MHNDKLERLFLFIILLYLRCQVEPEMTHLRNLVFYYYWKLWRQTYSNCIWQRSSLGEGIEVPQSKSQGNWFIHLYNCCILRLHMENKKLNAIPFCKDGIFSIFLDYSEKREWQRLCTNITKTYLVNSGILPAHNIGCSNITTCREFYTFFCDRDNNCNNQSDQKFNSKIRGNLYCIY